MNVFDRMVTEGNDAPETDNVDCESSDDGKIDVNEEIGCSRTSPEVKVVTQELLKYGYIEEVSRRDTFRRAIINERAIIAVLEPLDLILRIDTHRGVAFLAVAQEVSKDSIDEEGWSHPLVRRQRLTLEQSLLVAILRQAFVIHEQESGVGQNAAKIPIDDLLPQFLTYFGDSGSDAKNESRLLSLLDQLKTYGIVSEVDKKQEVAIRPLIAHLANPESLAALLRVLKEQSENADAQGRDGEC